MKNIFLFGQPGAGKTTLAKQLQIALSNRCINAMVIDGDDVRTVTGNDVYGNVGRIKNIDNAAVIAGYLNLQQIPVIFAMVAPLAVQRELIKQKFPNTIFVYLYYDRDSIARGREKFWTNIEGAFEPDEWVDTGTLDVRAAVKKILARYEKSTDSV